MDEKPSPFIKEKYFRFLLFVLFVSNIAVTSFGQSTISTAREPSRIKFESIANSQGLSQVTVLSIFQDHFGYLWIGTREGLNKYDGYKFHYYKNESGVENSISSDYISAIHEDFKNRLWIGTDNGINLFNRLENEFVRLQLNSKDKNPIETVTINTIYSDMNTGLLVGANTGLFHFDESKQRFEKIDIAHIEQSENVSFIQKINSYVIFSIGKGLFYYTSSGVHSIDIPLRSKSIIFNNILEDYLHQIWLGTNSGLFLLDENFHLIKTFTTGNPTKSGITNNKIKSLCFDDKNNLWAGTEKGLNIINESKDNIYHFFSDNRYNGKLSNDDINCIWRDNNNVMWIGTNSGGLNKFSWRSLRFSSLEAGQMNHKLLSNKDVFAIYEDDKGHIWLGTNHGLNKFDPRTSTIEYYLTEDKYIGKYGKIRKITAGQKNELLLGTYGGLIAFNFKSKNIRTIGSKTSSQHDILNVPIADILTEMDGGIWAGTKDSGLFYINERQNIIQRYIHNYNDSTSISSNKIRTLAYNPDGSLLIGTYGGGLNIYKPDTHQFKHIRNQPGNPQSISSNYIYTILNIAPDRYWIGTYGGGINYFDLKNETSINYTVKDGLPNEVVYGIISDVNGYLWITTNNGLSRFDPNYDHSKENNEPGPFWNFDINDGLLSNEFDFGAYYKTRNGVIILGNTNGVNYFQPGSLEPSTFAPRTEITEVSIFSYGEEKAFSHIRNISRTKELDLTYNTYFISIRFSSLQFGNPTDISYAFKLEGQDRNWIYLEKGVHHANYASLSGGEYIFKIKAANQDGIWSDNANELKIVIRKPFWQTIWFRLLVILIFILLAYTAHKIRTKRLKKHFEALEQINNSLTKEIEDRKKAETALFESENKYRTITNNLKVGVYRSEINENGKLLEVNPAFLELFGYRDKSEVINKVIVEFYQDQEERKALIKKIKEEGYVKDEVLHLLKKDGTPVICSNTSVVVKSDDGEDLYFDGILEDITELKKLVEALRESEEKYRNFVERAQDGILILQDSVFKYTNEKFAAMLETRVSDLLETPFIQYVHPDEKERLMDRYKRRMNNETLEPLYETVLVTKNGLDIYAEINAGLITYMGRPADLVFVRNITERRDLENQLRQIQKMDAIGLLAGGIAHDFNNIITIISGHSELALNELETDHKVFRLIKEIHKSSDRAANLTRQLLAFSRKQIIKPQVLNINTVIANMDKMLRRLIGEDINMKLILSTDVKDIKADPGQIEQIIMNLVINARDAILESRNPDKPKLITIETNDVSMNERLKKRFHISENKKYILFSVTDTGTGMDEDIVEKIFDPFFTTKETGKGTGLGLSTVFGIIKQNEGEIQVNSTPGSGSTFYIYWPVVDKSADKDDMNKPTQADIGGEEHILIVEDDAGVRTFARMALQQAGFTVFEAENGRAALNFVQNEKPGLDFLITDLVMPEMNGQELGKQIQKEYPGISILYTSGYTDRQFVNQGELDDSIMFLQKPYSAAQLNAKVREILDQKKENQPDS